MFEREYSFRGKYARCVKNLVESKLFERNIDVYILAPIVGFLYGKKAALDDNSESDEKAERHITTKIFTDQLLKEQPKLKFIYRLIMLLDETEAGLSIEDKVNRAFRADDNEEVLERNMQIFESYVLGGVEYLHDKLYVEGADRDECIQGLFEFVHDFREDLEHRESDESIIDIIREFELT